MDQGHVAEDPGPAPGGSGGENVSRSGRVRKKNVFLAEYESPDIIDKVDRVKKSGERGSKSAKGSHRSGSGVKGRPKKLSLSLPPEDFSTVENVGVPLKREISDIESRGGYESSDIDDRTNGHGHGRLSIVEQKPVKPKFAQPMKQKKKKKRVLENDDLSTFIPVKAKKVKKDKGMNKGPPRVTAYTLWMKEQREILSKKYPHLDPSTLTAKMGDMWQNLPLNQKKMWKNKADKTMKKTLNIKNSAPIVSLTEKGKKRGRPRIHPLPTDSPDSLSATPPPPKLVRRTGSITPSPNVTKGLKMMSPQIQKNKVSNGFGGSGLSPASYLQSRITPRKEDDLLLPGYRVTGTAPIDLAAHFALLGESLSTIGERLMDVERQPVSGSLSVLMDSLLCAMTPLVCLTQQIPELNCIPQEKLTRLLDHTAYIMPGL